ncbi:ATP-binding cassette domain-containing protein [Dysosmobacter sp. NSJ-60]|uniref:Ribose/galactose/methyl galactoside import ATP-binding protein n=2 Tax=Pusillibacter faecalis TaxID=2714358 RepID=A0A810QD55_9FIRM|nr:ATP-binding cassette domain-containing protein [Pusillibacter faecalis]MBC5746670.1 ATP-binding cassette domain-containing protein [Dysosmobacter hominis]MBS5657951.1 ATP-binding cassette domain-containing protein [Oscillibacter sp.]MCQ5025304.1 ATP-binding cassette domain-containing protein [Oscillibacter valericigenes]BCK83571.1 galactose/methyl galactoside import ATP-binding protein MglA [Pusillibacter faecalis]
MDQPALLEMRGITKEFPGVKALDGVNLTVRAGTVHALMGENGAGKSTLMKCLFGIYAKDSGTITLDGKEVSFKSSKEALENGVAMVHQELNQALTRSVTDNLWLGRYPKVGGIMVSEGIMRRRTQEIFEELDVHVDPRAIMSTLPVSQRQMVEIAKAVSYDSKVIVFDEPTSSLTEVEVEHLFRIINMLRSKGCGIIYISHKMEEILRISDDVTIMRDGQWVATRPAKELTMDEIIRLMVGRELTNRFPPKDNVPGDVILEVENLSGKYTRLQEASFQLHKGEILGIAGLDGSGRTEVLENLFGAMTKGSGTIRLHGREIRNRTPRESIKNGFALLTEERRATGIFGIRDIRDNTVISNLKNYLMGGICLSDKKMKADTDWAIQAMRIKTPSQSTQIRSLSGGNQQKVIIGRWLLTKPEVLLLDEPTRGIDVGAKYEIYQLIIELAKEGKGVIMVSSEMPELLGVCDRILVMSGGRLAGEVDAKATSQEEILTLAAKYV